MYKKYLTDKSSIPKNQLFEVAYTDFVKTPIENIEQAYRHLDLGNFEKAKPYLNEEIQSEENYKNNSYTGMDEKTKKKIEEQWGFFFEAYGYKK